MKDQAQTEEAPRIEIGSQTTNDLKIAGQKRGFRVLHVDDDPCILQVSKEILELEGNFEVDTALSVDEACKKLEQQTYDAVISDYEMPQKNGLQFLKELKQQKNEIPFILFTGKGREEVAVTALNLGADGYYNKQGSPETVYGELAHGIRLAVSRRKAEEALRVSEENYGELIDGMNDTAWVIDLDANFIDVNDAAVKVLGYSREELLSMGPTDIDNSLSREQIRDLVKRMPADQIQVFETAHTTKDGKTIPVEISSSLVTYQGKQAVLSIARDITERKKMVNALRESEEKYRRQFEEALDAIFVADAETGILVDCNPAACELVGREKTEIVGMHQQILHPPEKNDGELSRTFKEHLDKKKGQTLETQVITKSGEIKDVAIKANIFTLGNKTLMRGSFRDVTDRKKAEETLRASENYLKALLNSIFTGIVVVDEKTHEIVDANPNALEAIGASKEHVIGKVCHRFICPAEKGKCPISDLGQTVDRSERVLLRANGERVSILKTVTTATWGGSKYLVESFLDITERKKAEEVLQKSEETFKTLMEEAPIGICNTDLKGKITYVNKRFEEATGYSREEIVGKNGLKFGIMSNETSKALVKRIKERLMGKPSRIFEGQFKRKDGEWIWAEVEGRLIKKFRVPVGFQLNVRDITERKRAEKERKRYEESLSALNTYGRDLNLAKSMEEVYELTIDAAEKTLGFEFVDILMVEGKRLRIATRRRYFDNLSLGLPLDGDEGITVRAARTGKPVLVPDTSKDHAHVDVGLQTRSELVVPIKIGLRVLGVLNVESKKLDDFNEKDQELLEILASHAATAISNLDRARALEAYAREIRESQQMFERLFIDGPEAAVHLDSSFHILNVNPRFSRLFDYSLDEVKGRHIRDIIVPKDKTEEAVVFDERARKGESYHEYTVRKRKDGSLVSVALSAAPIIIENQVIGHIAVYKDISQLKKAEDELRKMLQKLDKMNEKLRVVGGLTRHDVRNKLIAVAGNAFLLKERYADQADIVDGLAKMEKACEEIGQIFDFAKMYEQLGVEELTYVNVEKDIGEAVALFSGPLNLKVINECHGLTVLADSFLRQLFYNFIDNTRKYGKKTTTIRVYYEKTESGELRLIYEDDGVGMPAENKVKLFTEGFSTGGSTGFGLFLSKKMMDVYGWTIQETGEAGKGAKFVITIPKVNQRGKENFQIT